MLKVGEVVLIPVEVLSLGDLDHQEDILQKLVLLNHPVEVLNRAVNPVLLLKVPAPLKVQKPHLEDLNREAFQIHRVRPVNQVQAVNLTRKVSQAPQANPAQEDLNQEALAIQKIKVRALQAPKVTTTRKKVLTEAEIKEPIFQYQFPYTGDRTDIMDQVTELVTLVQHTLLLI